jgi:hypothetical protein
MKTMMAILLTVLATTVAADDRKPPVSVWVSLEDGSSFPAATAGGSLVLKTVYGEQRIPYEQIKSLRRLRGSEFSLSSSSLSVTGELAADQFEFQNDLGRFRVPATDVRSLAPGAGFIGLCDTATVALWGFDDIHGNASFDLVKNRKMALQGMTPSPESDLVAAAVRSGDHAVAEVAGDPELDVPGDLTIEIRAKIGVSPRGQTSLLWKSDGNRSDYCLTWNQNNHLYIGANSNQGSYNIAIPTGAIPPTDWSYFAVVYEAKTRTVAVYLNGNAIHHSIGQFQPQVNGSLPLYFGNVPFSPGALAAPAAVQFVRLSNTARKAEDIRECQLLLESAKSTAGPGSGEGAHLRGGGFVRAKFPGLAGAAFKTAWGTLRLPEGMGGRLTLYRLRPEALGEARTRAADAVRALGESSIEAREAAMARIMDSAELAVPYLREATNERDSEVRARAETILKKLDAAGATSRPVADVLTIGPTVLHGWLEATDLEVVSSYGSYTVSITRLQGINLGAQAPSHRRVFRLKSGESVQGEATGAPLELKTGFGRLAVPLRDLTGLSYDDKKSVWGLTTDRLSATGTLEAGELNFETPAGKLAVPIVEIRGLVTGDREKEQP